MYRDSLIQEEFQLRELKGLKLMPWIWIVKPEKNGFLQKGAACLIPDNLMCQKHDKALIFCHAGKIFSLKFS